MENPPQKYIISSTIRSHTVSVLNDYVMLYPIRIDATSQDKTVRLIESILLDPKCLPIPIPIPIPTLTGTQCFSGNERYSSYSQSLKDQTIDRNAKFLASSLVADMEVHGINKSSKSYLGRIKLLNCRKLIKTVEEQIKSQLLIIFEEDHISFTSKRRKIDVKECPENTRHSTVNDTSNLIKVRIRIRDRGIIAIPDEFLVDPLHPASNPLILAKSLASDLNLPDVVVNSIALSIAEQICGLYVDENIDSLTASHAEYQEAHGIGQNKIGTMKTSPEKLKTSAAWVVNNGKEIAEQNALLLKNYHPS